MIRLLWAGCLPILMVLGLIGFLLVAGPGINAAALWLEAHATLLIVLACLLIALIALLRLTSSANQ